MTAVIEKLAESIRNAASYNASAQSRPVAILWPDKECQWQPVLHQLRKQLPELLTLGAYSQMNRCGPAIWIKCVVARELSDFQLPDGRTPIVYLPNVSRAELRRVENSVDAIKPLIEVQYRGAVWDQFNGKDWTVNAFLTAGVDGLGLDVAKDRTTQEALIGALEALIVSDFEQLEGRRLEAIDFNQLLSSDPIRDLLSWMNSPVQVKSQWDSARWNALCSIAQADFGLDINADGELMAAEMLCRQDGKWAQVWQRFNDNPAANPALLALLKRVNPPDLLAEPDRYWAVNNKAESDLQQALVAAALSKEGACAQVRRLEEQNAERRSHVWAKLGESPWATTLEPLNRVATGVAVTFSGLSPDEMAEKYAAAAWEIDAAVLNALEVCVSKEQERVVEGLLATIYKPWLAAMTERFQDLVQRKGYPGSNGVSEATRDYLANGEVIFFVDGLRLDVAHRLQDLLNAKDRESTLGTHWSALPSVTATAKAAISPVFASLEGDASETDFEPSVIGQGRLSNDRFKKLLANANWQCLDAHELGDPKGKAWIAVGDIDKEGHRSGLKLAKRIPGILHTIVERVEELLDHGWQKVRIVTDHGWLLVPGEMPKSQLPVQATDSRWGRCAQLKQNVQVPGLTLGWYWNLNTPIHYPYGIHSFIAGRTYAHGGVSLQECLVPVISVKQTVAEITVSARIEGARWRGLSCRVELAADGDVRVDLRTKVADPSSSLVTPKTPVDGGVTLMVEDDGNEGLSAVIVVLDESGTVIAKTTTVVGSDD